MSTSSPNSPTLSGGAVVVAPDPDSDEGPPADYDAHGWFHVVDHGWIVAPKHAGLVAPEPVLAATDIDSLHAALLQGRCCGSLPEAPETIAIALGPVEDFHPQASDYDDVDLYIDAQGVYGQCSLTSRRRPPWPRDELVRLLRPAAAAHHCVIHSVEYLVDGVDIDGQSDALAALPEALADEWRTGLAADVHEIRILVGLTTPATARPLIAAARDTLALLEAIVSGGALTARTARNLLLAGLPHLLLGLPESDWLEVKRSAYGLDLPGDVGNRQKIELAQDAARFANGSVDALLVIGFREGKDTGVARLKTLAPAPLANLDADRYRDVLDNRIVPPIEGLTVDVVDLGNSSGMLVIGVPAQPQELQPFLVHGVIAADKVEGAFFSIVRRRGEGSITMTASQIHAYIVAGKAYLRSSLQERE